MGDRIAPDGGRRFSYALLAFAVVASLVQVVSVQPALAVAGENGPAVIAGTDSSGLTNSSKQWDTKNQHRIWWNSSASRWDAILPASTTVGASNASAWMIAKGAIPTTFGAAPTYGPQVGTYNSADRPDIYWDNSLGRLYVLMSGGTTQLYVYNYSGGNYSLAGGYPVSLPNMGSGNPRAAIYKTPNGDLWASLMKKHSLLVTRSNDDGATWGTPVNLNVSVDEGQTQLTHFVNGDTFLAVAAAENGDKGNDDGRYSKYLFYRLDLTTDAANWNAITRATGTLSIPVQPVAGETVTIGSRTYAFEASPLTDVSGHVLLGANAAATQVNLVAAINGSGTPGVQYAASTLPHGDVTIGNFGANTATISARDSAVVGLEIGTTETMLGAGDDFGAATLAGGSSSWVSETIPLAQGSAAPVVVHADDELSLVSHNNTIYIATETQRSGSGGNKSDDPQVILYRRTAGGSWTQSNVKMDQQSTTGDRKRPVVAIVDSTVYVIAIDNPQTNSAYWTKLETGIPSLGTGWGSTTPLFDTPFEKRRNNIVPRDPTTSATGLPVLIDFAWDVAGDDTTVWQTLLPNSHNQAPGVYAGPDTAVSASPATSLDSATVTTDSGTVNWSWSVVSGPGAVNFTHASGSCSLARCNPLGTTAAFAGGLGTYVLRLTATESGGASTNPLTNYDDVTITVNNLVNTPPALTVTNPKNGDTYSPGAEVTFSATANDAQSGNISAAIVWTSNKDGVIGNGGSFVKTNLTSGTHIIKANVTDGQNAVASPNITITIGSGGGGGGGGSGTFTDDDGNIFENAIEWLAGKGITQGCNPPANTHYCPNDPVTRGQMAVFLVRAFSYSDNGGGNLFIDDDGLFYENSADRLFTAGVTVGCNPPTNNKYCGEKNVTRGQMAAFLARAFSLPAYTGADRFTDDNGDIFEGAIERLAQAGITLGCNPPANTHYCPNDNVTRGQMAAFLKRAFGE